MFFFEYYAHIVVCEVLVSRL